MRWPTIPLTLEGVSIKGPVCSIGEQVAPLNAKPGQGRQGALRLAQKEGSCAAAWPPSKQNDRHAPGAALPPTHPARAYALFSPSLGGALALPPRKAVWSRTTSRPTLRQRRSL
jgi:hypothetical protein